MGGYVFSRGALLPLLKNRLYLGEIVHRGQSYLGRHQAILDPQTFDGAQALLETNSRRRRDHVSYAGRMPLVGLVYDAAGQLMALSTHVGPKQHYRYYVAPPLLRWMRRGRGRRHPPRASRRA